MGIPDEDITRVRDAVDIVALISEHVQLKKSGARWVGLCPFHAEKSPSFSVNQQQGLYYCFGCGAKGDAITFVREVNHLDFVEAVESLARRTGTDIRFDDPDDDARRRRRTELARVVAEACDWFHQLLMSAPEAGAARNYLRGRGFDRDMVEFYRMGWSPTGTGDLRAVLGYDIDTMIAAGLMHPGQDGRPARDVFIGRVMFPIMSPSGDPVGFGGRVLPDGKGPKYKNSPDGLLYNKSRVLYGLNWAKSEIVASDQVLVCEGYTDVIAARSAGVTTTVATCGTALTDEHARLLARYTKNVVLGFDADTAGQNAAARFHQWEHQYGFVVSVLQLPEGSDPADVASGDPNRFAALVRAAPPFLRVRVDHVLRSADLSSPEGRAVAAKQAAAVVAEHPDPVLRGQYLRDIAERTGSDPNTMIAATESNHAANPPPNRRSGTQGTAQRLNVPTSVEFEALQVMASDRDEIVDLLVPALFTDPVHRAAFEMLEQHVTPTAASERCDDPVVADLVIQAAMEPTGSDPYALAKRLVTRAAQTYVKSVLNSAAAGGDGSSYLLELVQWTKQTVMLLDDPDPQTSGEAFAVLLEWVRDGFTDGDPSQGIDLREPPGGP